jgi:precorrin-8X/cobalt-precorrin-8 methylmutase
MAPQLFDRYVFVDWSASSKPSRGKDSIWFAAGSAAETSPPQNPATRDQATEELGALLIGAATRRERVLIGFDFSYGYPAGFAVALGLAARDAPWRRTWTRLRDCMYDGANNANRRFQDAADLNRAIGSNSGPFWGHAASFSDEALTWKVEFPVKTITGWQIRELRHTERHLRRVKRSPLPVWKLAGQGAVGSQTLLGIPRVAALRDDPRLAAFSLVWPFETGFGASRFREDGPFILHAEIWPGVLDLDSDGHPIRDARQVLALVQWARGLDQRGQLAREFEAPPTLAADEVAECVDEEGWILGSTTAGPRPASTRRRG